MDRLKLTLDTLSALDGGMVGLMVDQEIRKAVADLEDRGEEDKQARTVSIKVAMALVEGRPAVKVAVTTTLPPLKSRTTAGKFQTELGKHYINFASDIEETPDALFGGDDSGPAPANANGEAK